jgi:parallel beta-helix repeat protein
MEEIEMLSKMRFTQKRTSLTINKKRQILTGLCILALIVTLNGTASAKEFSLWEYIQESWSSLFTTVSAENNNKSDDAKETPSSSGVVVDFESFNTGTVEGQDGWRSAGSNAYGTGFDVEITDNNTIVAPKSFGTRSLRVSNALTSDSTAEQTFAKSLPNEGGESGADNLGQQRGTRGKLFTSEWEFASADPNTEQYGASVVVSPTRGDGAQMSYVRMADLPDGLGVFFKEYKNGGFSEVQIIGGLDRTQAHKIRLDIAFADGAGNDAVNVYVNNELRHEGTTWEDFYRAERGGQVPTIDTISFSADGMPFAMNRGKGFLIDNVEMNSLVGPTVLSISRLTPSAQIVNATSVVFRVVFDMPVNNVDANDFTFTGSTVSGPQVTNINTSSPFTTYDITVANYTGDGNLQLNVIVHPTNPILSNPGGEPITGGFNGGANAYTIDNTAPTVSSITLPSANPTTAASVQFTVTFSENVQGVDNADFSLSTTGSVMHGGIATITNVGPVYTVTVTGITGDGTLGLNVLDDDTITDFVSPTPYSLNGGATGPTYTVDNTDPTVLSVNRGTPAGMTTNALSVQFVVTFSENVTGVDPTDFNLSASTVTGASVQNVSGSNATYTVTVSGYSGSGTLDLDVLDDNTIIDQVSNPLNGGFTGGQTYTINAPPNVSISDVTANETDSGTTNFDFTVTLSAASTEVITINYATTDGTATQPSDYASASGTLTFDPNVVDPNADGDNNPLTQRVSVAVNGDQNNEANETFTVDLTSSDPDVNTGAPSDLSGLGTITNDDNATLNFSAATYSIGENGGTATITVTRSGALGDSVTANYFTAAGGTATGGATCTAGVDYINIASTPLVFAVNDTSEDFTVTICDDSVFENANETVNLEITAVSPATVGAQNTAVLTINDNEVQPTVSISATTDGAEPSSDASFTVTLSGQTVQQVTVDYAFGAGGDTATAGTDYNNTGGTVTFTANTTTLMQTINVPVIDDNLFEGTETFTITLSNQTNAGLGTATDTADITDEETAPTVQFSAATYSVGENGGTVTITATRTGATGDAFTVPVTFTDGTATGGATCGAGIDYDNDGTTLSFAAGDTSQSYNVPICDDANFESNETFTATLGTPSSPAVLGTPAMAGVTITEDEIQPTVQFSAATYSVGESGPTVTLTATRTGATGDAFSVGYSLSNGTATGGATCGAGVDFVNTGGTLNFATGDTSKPITVSICEDLILETGGEDFTVTLGTPTAPVISGSPSSATVTINDNDVNIVYVNDDWVGTTPGTDPDGGGPATNFGLDAFATVQGGVNGVAIGGTVIVYDGNYIEQVVISKNLTMDGGENDGGMITETTISIPSTPAETLPTNAVGDVVIVDINNGATVSIQDLTVSGTFNYSSCAGPYHEGIYVNGAATLNLSNATVKDIRPTNPALFGCRTNAGFGASVGGAFANQTGTLNIDNVTFSGYQKGALYIDGLGTSASVENSTFIGAGPSGTAQNIFQISSDATADIQNNDIGTTGAGSQCNVPYNPPPNPGCGPQPDQYQGSGVLLSDAGAVTITNNTFTDNDNAISTYGANGNLTITNNTFSGNRYYGMLLGQGTTTATGNTMSAPMNVGISVYTDSDDTGNANLTFNQNTITGATTGLQMIDFDLMNIVSQQTEMSQIVRGAKKAENPTVSSLNVPSVTANYNRIVSTTTAIDNPQNNTHNLEYNWWGCNAGPGNAGCGAVIGTGADFTPWVVLTASATPLSITPGGTSTVSADLSKDNTNTALAQSIPDTPVAYTATNGTMSPTSDVITNNTVDTSVFTSTNSSNATATVTVDNQPITFNITVNAPSFTIDDVTMNEGDSGMTNFVFTVTKTGTTAFSTSVDFATNDVSATSPSDYAAQSLTTLTFGPADTTMTVTVVVNGDTMFEPTETFEVNLSNPMMATISDAQGIGTITNDDTQPTVQFNPATATDTEDNVNQYITITATRTGASGDAFTVGVSFGGGDATGGAACGAGIDYVNTGTTLSFAAGDNSESFNVPICNDAIFEGDETFVATLGTPSSPVILGTQTTATVTIVEGPETEPTVSISDATPNPVAEGNSATFNVTLSNPSDEAITVSVSIGAMGDTAVAADYSLVTTSVTFPANTTGPQTVTVNALTDNLFEGPTAETFTVNLVSVTTSNATILDGAGAGSISDVDVCNFVVTATSPTSYPYTPPPSLSGTFSVTVTNGCQWSAGGSAPWITSTSTGNGNGTGTYSIADNTATQTNNGEARNGFVIVSGTNNGGSGQFGVSQAASPVFVDISDTLTSLSGGNVTVPVEVLSTVTGRFPPVGVISFDFSLTFDPAVLQYTGNSTTGTMSSGCSITQNFNNTAGTVQISGVCINPLSGFGTLVNLNFSSPGGIGTFSNMNFTNFTFNSGNPADSTSNGLVTIVSGTITGKVTYLLGAPNTPVPNATISAAGSIPVSDVTDANGDYSLSGLGAGVYTVTPSKTGQANGIQAFDSALIAQHVVNLITLSANQLLAADVSNDSVINSFDAALIAQYTVNIPNPSITGTWKFVPANRVYSPGVTMNQTNQDYSAILMGDVDGNWDPNTPFAEPLRDNSFNPIPVTAPTQGVGQGVMFNIPLTVGDTTGQNVISYQFDLVYNDAVITPQMNPCEVAGTISANMLAFCNVSPVGTLKVSVFGFQPLVGAGTLLKLKFTAVGAPNTSSPLSLQNFVFNNGVPDDVTMDGQINILPPLAAVTSVGGRVVDASGNGRPLVNTTIVMTGTDGVVRTTRADKSGGFIFTEIPVGQTYTISVRSKVYRFNPVSINVQEKIDGLIITAEP